MIRKIVEVRSHDWLIKAKKSRSFAMAKSSLIDTLHPTKFTFDEKYSPSAINRQLPNLRKKPKEVITRLASPQIEKESSYTLVAHFEDEDAVDRLIKENPEEVRGVYSDPKIYAIAEPYCGGNAVEDDRAVARKLGVKSLHQKGITGKNVRVVIVDTGINGTVVPVAGGWVPPSAEALGYTPGSWPRLEKSHGTMTAWDTRISAPDAQILDYALLLSSEGTWTAFLSDAITAFADLIELLQRKPGPLVVNNSWGMFNTDDDEPVGSPGNYYANPEHPFNQIVSSLVGEGADVFFAAGNCGNDCPDGRCGSGDIGHGVSIHGANSHPDVITVAAITTDHRRLGYSSQGPGILVRQKPDIAGYSHFKGSGAYQSDAGTSAACPVAAGVVSALRQQYPDLTPDVMKGVIQRTATDVNNTGWDYEFGFGVIHGGDALELLERTHT